VNRASLVVASVAAGLALGAPSAQAELRVGENVRLDSSDLTEVRAKDAVALAVNPRNPQHIVSINADWLPGDCEYTASFDGGSNWTKASVFALPAGFIAESCKVGGHLGQAIDRGLAFGSGDNVYATFATPKVSSTGAEEADSVLVAKSTDGGRTFGTGVVALAGASTSSGTPRYGLPKLAVDPARPGGPAADRVYLIAGNQESTTRNTVTSVSNDGGQNFSAPVFANKPGEDAIEQSQPVIAPDGAVLVAWRQRNKDAAGNFTPEGFVVVGRSTDQGKTWTQARAANVRGLVYTGPPTPTYRTPPSTFTGSTFPRLAVDQGSGNVYLVFGQGPPAPTTASGFQAADHFIHFDMDVFFQRSTNGGANWSPPLQINDSTPFPGSEVTQTRHPDVSVAPNGRVDVVWEDRRHWYRGCIHTHERCEEARLGDIYYANSSTGGADFSPDRRITDRSHNNDVGIDYRFGTYWDFGPVSVPLGNDQILVGWMDSRRGNHDNDNQDGFLAKVNLQGPSAVPQESLSRPDDTDLSVALSNVMYPGGGEAVLQSTFANRPFNRVVIVNERNVSGALAGGVLARGFVGSVLLSPGSGLPANVKAEVTRLDPVGAYVIGDEGSLSAEVVKDLADAGVPADRIDRVAAPTEAGIANGIADRIDRRSDVDKAAGVPAFDAAVIANPDSPDASAVAGLAAARRLPVLYVGQNSVPETTSDALRELAINKTLVIGGPGVVSDAVVAQLPGAQRLGGANQYETSAAVVRESRGRGLPDNIAYVANGIRSMDAALAGAAAGRAGGMLVLSPGPLRTASPGVLSGVGLSGGLDRAVLIQPTDTAAQDPGGGDGGGSTASRCLARIANVVRGNASRNVIRGTPGVDRILAGAGKDRVNALPGNDCVNLGPGADIGGGENGNDLVQGGGGKDRITGGLGNDRLGGGSANDRLTGGPGRDRGNGDRGNDRAIGGRGNDRLSGGAGKDLLSGGPSNDRLNAGPGRDRLSGGTGRDRINTRDGKRGDRITCGRGRDTVIADRGDRVSRDCERVRKSRAKRRRGR
jgi:Ca2+-binding RTX toxin-like protein